MAQVLKQELRENIIEAAKDEFLENGFEKASMRSIASKASMTVGNLYRYFKSKEDIARSIIKDTIKALETTFKSLRSDNVSMQPRVFSMKADTIELSNLMDNLADRLVDSYFEHKTEFNILILHTDYNSDIVNWFSKSITSLIEQHFLLESHKEYRQILSNAYAIAIYSGVREIFKNNNLDPITLKRIISIYLNSYIVLLDSGYDKLNI